MPARARYGASLSVVVYGTRLLATQALANETAIGHKGTLLLL